MNNKKTAYAQYFEDRNLVLKYYPGAVDRAVLHVEYRIDEGLSLSVYDSTDVMSSYTARPDTAKDLGHVIRKIQLDYGMAIPLDITLPAYEFLDKLPHALAINVELAEEDTKECLVCGGLHTDRLVSSYFPPFDANSASLEAHFYQNCGRGYSSASLSDNPVFLDEVFAVIDAAFNRTIDEDTKAEIQHFKKRVIEALKDKSSI